MRRYFSRLFLTSVASLNNFRFLSHQLPTTRESFRENSESLSTLPLSEETGASLEDDTRWTYLDPSTGLSVFTREFHLRRGFCCGSGCRHCPFDQLKADEKIRGNLERINKFKEAAGSTTIHINATKSHLNPCSTLYTSVDTADHHPKIISRPMSSTASSEQQGKTSTSPASIVTRRGDAGVSSIATGQRLSKASQIFTLLGTLDELNAHIGLAHAQLQTKDQPEQLDMRLIEAQQRLSQELQIIQRHLQSIASIVASCNAQRHSFPLQSWTDELETSIAYWDSQLTPLRGFVLPGGSGTFALSAAQLHVGRTVARRCEREAVDVLLKAKESPPEYLNVCRFINRLSDYLFQAARIMTQKDHF